MAADHFCLRWNNYQSNMVSELDSLRNDEDLVDVTISCEGHQLKAHKVILSACSSYFRNVFKENPCKHPVVILKNVNFDDVEALLSFVYQGVVYVSEKKLSSFLQTAELLQIRGLAGAASTISSSQNKIPEKSNVPPPPLLTANQINWKHQRPASPSPVKKPLSDPPSPSIVPAIKRRKPLPSKGVSRESYSEGSDTNSNQESSETDTDMVKTESLDAELQDNNNFYPEEENSKDDSNRESNNYYEPAEADDTEEDEEDDDDEQESAQKDMNLITDKSISVLYSNPLLDVPGNAANAFNLPSGFQLTSHPTTTNAVSIEQTTASATDQQRLGKRPCPLCQKIISNKSNLLKHMRIRHSDEYNPARCNLCGKVFKNKYSLRAHYNIYHKELNSSCITSTAANNFQQVMFPVNAAILPSTDFNHSQSSLTLHNVTITNHQSNSILFPSNNHSNITLPASINDFSPFASAVKDDLPFSISAISDS